MKHTHLVPVAALLLVVPTFAQQSTMPDPQMKAVLDQLTSLGGKPIESLARGRAPAADTRRCRGKCEPQDLRRRNPRVFWHGCGRGQSEGSSAARSSRLDRSACEVNNVHSRNQFYEHIPKSKQHPDTSAICRRTRHWSGRGCRRPSIWSGEHESH